MCPEPTLTTSAAATTTVGTSVPLTATATSSGTTPTGTITFKNGTTTLGTAPLHGAASAALDDVVRERRRLHVRAQEERYVAVVHRERAEVLARARGHAREVGVWVAMLMTGLVRKFTDAVLVFCKRRLSEEPAPSIT